MADRMNGLLINLVAMTWWSWSVFVVKGCPDAYRHISATHTYCLPANESCQILSTGVTDEQKVEIVRLHNEYRSKIATGGETTGNLQPATDMLQMVWDNELAAVAQKHTERCIYAHDCSDCREVPNFGVSQNIFQTLSSSSEVEPTWHTAVRKWYEEVNLFNPNHVDSFHLSEVHNIGHFTAMIWAKTWRVGCGYTKHVEGENFQQLLTCNYGPGGNIEPEKVYTRGEACRDCPENTCCGSDCGGEPVYEGLCQVSTDEHPIYSPSPEYTIYCDFEKDDCGVSNLPDDQPWGIATTLSGSYVTVVLKGGQSSTVNFTKVIPAAPAMCLTAFYRKGPNIAGEESSNKAKVTFHIAALGYDTGMELTQDSRQYFRETIDLPPNEDYTVSVTFSALEGAPDQYLDITDISIKDSGC